MNAEKGELVNLHSIYTSCLKVKLDAWLKDGQGSQEHEWCAAEKQAYLAHMRHKVPV
jgi:hypothetical protein